MEGALPSVVCGLVDVPVIGLPVSTGYGFGGRGEAALLGMLQSCSPGLVVVNIDNGVGAGVTAALIARRGGVRQLALLLRDRREERARQLDRAPSRHGRRRVPRRAGESAGRAAGASCRRRSGRALAGGGLRGAAASSSRIESEAAADAARRGALGFDLVDVIAGVQQSAHRDLEGADRRARGGRPARRSARPWTRCSRSTPSWTCWCASRCEAFSRAVRGRRPPKTTTGERRAPRRSRDSSRWSRSPAGAGSCGTRARCPRAATGSSGRRRCAAAWPP